MADTMIQPEEPDNIGYELSISCGDALRALRNIIVDFYVDLIHGRDVQPCRMSCIMTPLDTFYCIMSLHSKSVLSYARYWAHLLERCFFADQNA